MEGEHLMKAEEILNQIRDVATVRRVFGEPIEHDGVTIIPVARVMGGGGGGQGPKSPRGTTAATAAKGAKDGATAEGEAPGGVGMGFIAVPAGVYVI